MAIERERWLVYATTRQDIEGVARAVRKAGCGWKPLAVDPTRLADALTAIQPRVVVVDASLQDDSVQRMCHRYGDQALITNDGDLPVLTDILATAKDGLVSAG